jgi:FMN phosphatase YigB (HAD superfamily)
MKTKTVLFIDLDNTIFINPFEKAIFPLVTTQISNDTGLPAESIKKMLLLENRHRIDDVTDPSLAYDWDDIARVVAERLGTKFDLSIEQLVEEYARSPYIEILENVEANLSRIRKPHRLVVAATNGLSKYQLPVLRALGIENLFDVFVAPDLANALKGYKEFYGSLLDEGELAISIGDNYEQDIVGPKKLGMHTILINRQVDSKIAKTSPFERINKYDFMMNKQVYPDAIIVSFEELPSVINEIESQCL